MSDLLDSDGPDYDPEAYLEAADNDRKARRERGEGRLVVVEDPKTCDHEFGQNHRFVCCLQTGHLEHGIPHHYFGSVRLEFAR